jgi:hypothetical protein
MASSYQDAMTTLMDLAKTPGAPGAPGASGAPGSPGAPGAPGDSKLAGQVNTAIAEGDFQSLWRLYEDSDAVARRFIVDWKVLLQAMIDKWDNARFVLMFFPMAHESYKSILDSGEDIELYRDNIEAALVTAIQAAWEAEATKKATVPHDTFAWDHSGRYETNTELKTTFVINPQVFEWLGVQGWHKVARLSSGGHNVVYEVVSDGGESAVAVIFSNNIECLELPEEIERVMAVMAAQDAGTLPTRYMAHIMDIYKCPFKLTTNPAFCPGSDVPTYITIEEKLPRVLYDEVAMINQDPRHRESFANVKSQYDEASAMIVSPEGYIEYKTKYPLLQDLVDDFIPIILEISLALIELAGLGWFHDDAHVGNWGIRANGEIVLIDLDSLHYIVSETPKAPDAKRLLWSISAYLFPRSIHPGAYSMGDFGNFIADHFHYANENSPIVPQLIDDIGAFSIQIPHSYWHPRYRVWGEYLDPDKISEVLRGPIEALECYTFVNDTHTAAIRAIINNVLPENRAEFRQHVLAKSRISGAMFAILNLMAPSQLVGWITSAMLKYHADGSDDSREALIVLLRTMTQDTVDNLQQAIQTHPEIDVLNRIAGEVFAMLRQGAA